MGASTPVPAVASMPPTGTVPFGAPPAVLPGAPGYWPGTPYMLPPKKKRLGLVVAIVIVALVVLIGLAAAVYFLTPAKAHFVSITKTGLDANGNMTFDVRFVTEGPPLGVNRLHLNMRSVQNGVEYDAIYYYNPETLSAGTHRWRVDIAVNSGNVSAFSYEFELEVNRAVVDRTAVT